MLMHEPSISPLLEDIKNNNPCARGDIVEYFNSLPETLKGFRLEPSDDSEFDEKIVESIEKFIPARDRLIKVFDTIAQYDSGTCFTPALHKFFELLIPYLKVIDNLKVANVDGSHEWHGDNLKFIVQEIFMLCVAIFLKYERYDILAHLLNKRYLVIGDENHHHSTMKPFGIFQNGLETLMHRNNRLKSNRASIHADIIKERCADSGLAFDSMMQADFLLYLTDAINAVREKRSQNWWPGTLAYKMHRGGTFEIFIRAESAEYFGRLGQVLGIKQKSDLNSFIEGIRSGSIRIPEWIPDRINPLELMNYERLCIYP